MGKLPVLSGRDVIKALQKAGFEVHHQTGSHVIVKQIHPPHLRLSVPDHGALKRGLLRAIIRDAGLTREQFDALLER